MPRRHRLRKVVAPPRFKGFKPYGQTLESKGFIELHYEEYEAIKLADYDLMNHLEAGALMGVSRPTFARIYESARRKIAKALVEAKEIKTVFGNATIDKDWFFCTNCKARFTLLINQTNKVCPICKSENTQAINQ
jgi:predicted DNA-binding protein (UPF0251 family)